jgi:hypothetical protein
MLKKSASGVPYLRRTASRRQVASLRPSTYPRGYASVLRSLRSCLRNGAPKGEESVLADSGRAGEITAGVGWVRSLAILSILWDIHSRFQRCSSLISQGPTLVSQPVRAFDFAQSRLI